MSSREVFQSVARQVLLGQSRGGRLTRALDARAETWEEERWLKLY